MNKTTAYVRKGNTRTRFSITYHEIFDLYHPYIGDKATLYYLFLVRYRDNNEHSRTFGKAWRGRAGIVAKFQISYSTLPLLDDILQAAGLIDVETRPSGRGRSKIYYTVHDPLDEDTFECRRGEMEGRLQALVAREPTVAGLLGKERKGIFLR